VSRGRHARRRRSGTAGALKGIAVVAVAVGIGSFVAYQLPSGRAQTERTSLVHSPRPVVSVARRSVGHHSAPVRRTTHSTAATTTTTTSLPPSPPPSEVKVLVANATQVQHAAGDATQFLISHGYAGLAPVNATAQRSSTTIYFEPGYEGAAFEVATVLGVALTDVQPVSSDMPVASSEGADVIVVEGPGLASRMASSSPSST
jgi:hypothetical protein